jgi:AmmeMemoRadiSam system protein A
MAPLSSIDALGETLGPYIRTLHELAGESIRSGFHGGRPAPVRASEYAPALQTNVATFVTLRLDGQLRGCVGTAIARRPLVEDIAINAFGAAFHDLRFPPLSETEFDLLSIELSALSAPEPLTFIDEDDLVAQLVPGRDGLILEHHGRHGLFLPQVWDMLPDPSAFLKHLKAKAGLPAGPLETTVRALHFAAVKLPEAPVPAASAAD